MFAAEHLSYSQTKAFTRIVEDYLSGVPQLRSFFNEPASLEGIISVIGQKMKQPVDRQLLVTVLKKQYEGLENTPAVQKNIEKLGSQNCFTVCTAHQPNLFTGPLYFIYKILHAIRLAAWLKEKLPQHDFVPVYFMGSEDADFAELNHTYVQGKKVEWKKEQKGAVGRMVVDHTLLLLIDELQGQLGGLEYGKEVIELLRSCYQPGTSIQEATFRLVNALYGQWGLVVLIPDEALLKASVHRIFSDDIFRNLPSSFVQKTSEELGKHYEVQAYPRAINLFYLKDNIRERIVQKDGGFEVLHTGINFTDKEMKEELEQHPERFSPNVILRGIFQESILPNIAFIGGGGETAYWLQLGDLFRHYGIVFPVLVLRNSFLLVNQKAGALINKLELKKEDLFRAEHELMNLMVARYSTNQVSLNGSLEKAGALYDQIGKQAEAIDPTLSRHVAALKTRSIKTLEVLQKKMLRAEKRKFSDQQGQIEKLKAMLFPYGGLQERKENFSGFYAEWGRSFISEIYQHSLALEQQFTILYQTGLPSHRP